MNDYLVIIAYDNSNKDIRFYPCSVEMLKRNLNDGVWEHITWVSGFKDSELMPNQGIILKGSKSIIPLKSYTLPIE